MGRGQNPRAKARAGLDKRACVLNPPQSGVGMGDEAEQGELPNSAAGGQGTAPRAPWRMAWERVSDVATKAGGRIKARFQPWIEKARARFNSLKAWLDARGVWFPKHWSALGIGLVVCGSVLAIWLIWYFGKDFFDAYERLRVASTNDGKEGAEALRHLITTIGAIVGGVFTVAFVGWRQWLLHRQTKIAQE